MPEANHLFAVPLDPDRNRGRVVVAVDVGAPPRQISPLPFDFLDPSIHCDEVSVGWTVDLGWRGSIGNHCQLGHQLLDAVPPRVVELIRSPRQSRLSRLGVSQR